MSELGQRGWRTWMHALVVGAALVLAGCAGPLPSTERPASHALSTTTDDSALQRYARASDVPADRSGFWPIAQGAFALDARLTLLRQATHSLDLQYYLLADDSVGRNVMRELRDASQRGVRVRLLLDDLYTSDIEEDLRALATYPNIEVRVFNPFVLGRTSTAGRALNFLGDFRRLNHRMHNKLLVADNALAILGGRNLADEYFLRGKDANFLDIDVLTAGAVVPQASAVFDRYWNSEQVFPLASLGSSSRDTQELRSRFSARVQDPELTPTIDPIAESDLMGQPALSSTMAQGRQRFVVADARIVADDPAKASPGGGGSEGFQRSMTAQYIDTLRMARTEIVIFSPYFVPGRKGVERLAEARARGVEVRVVTNAMGSSDEPLVNQGYHHYRRDLLGMGVQLYEISSQRVSGDAQIGRALGRSKGRLHAKMAFVDRSIVMVGSMNVDLRSAYSNTEVGIGIRSPELARLIMEAYRADGFSGAYEVRLKGDGSGLEWVGRGDDGETVLLDEPEVGWLQRLKLWLLFLFVPEDLL